LEELEVAEYTVKVEELTGTLTVSSEAPFRPATLRVTDLGISRAQAGVGDPITVSATATNIGDEAGEFTLELYVNDQQRETQTIQLGSKESETVQFEVIENTEGDYIVKLGDVTTQFTISAAAEPAKPAEFQLSQLVVEPTTVVDGSLTVSVKVTNIGEEEGTYTVDLKIDGASRQTEDVTLSGGAIQTVKFDVSETASGAHTVEVGTLSDSFEVENLAPPSKDVEITGVTVRPYEVWEGDTVTVTVKASNLVSEAGTLQVQVSIGDSKITKGFEVPGDATDQLFDFKVTAGPVGGYSVKLLNLGNEEDTASGYFKVVETGMHTLSVGSYPVLGIPFKLDGVEYQSPYSVLLPEGEYTLEVEPTYKSGSYIFIGWEDGSTTLTRTITLDERMSVTPDFSGGVCCPSVYSWNGTGYHYLAEISNGGWLGYIGYINEDGTVVFVGGNPWDSIKLYPDQLQTKQVDGNEYYDIILNQRWDEIIYLDAVYMLVVDHPADVDVYSTMVRYTNPAFSDEIYTVSTEPLTPVSAVNQNGEDVLAYISKEDGVFASGINGLCSESWTELDWNQLTVNLGDLSGAEQIKLIVNGMVNWGPADTYYEWIEQFKVAATEGLVSNGTEITPPPFIEVLDAEGNWVRVPEERQMPIPADYVARPFVVDMTGIFLTDNYTIRINNFWNVSFDYIGVDITPQESITVQRIDPDADFVKVFEIASEASGDFTKYGDVTELIRECDDKFVIAKQGDKIACLFPVDELAPPEEGTERDFFLFGACWFKDTPTNWGYGFDFTVEPIPFQDMSGFPYTDAESYPYDEEHNTYLQEYNTRKVVPASSLEPQPASFPEWAGGVLLIMAIVDVAVIYYRKRNK
jgi:hypothetical protein